MPLDDAGKKQLRTRLLIGPTLLAVLAGIFFLDRSVTDGRAAAGVIMLLALGGLWEYVAMMRGAGFPIGRRVLLGAGAGLHGSAFAFTSWGSIDVELYPPILITVALVFALSVRALARSRMEKGLEEVGSTLLGFVLLAWPLYFAQGLAMRSIEALFFVVLVSKSGDIGGYFVGIALGRKKLIPWVSPGKSIEGALGSLGLACLVSWALSGVLLHSTLSVSLLGALGLGALINVTTQLGDLVESLLKRRCGVKDSSTMLPVHGGVLDLVDSLLFSLPAFLFVLVRFTGP